MLLVFFQQLSTAHERNRLLFYIFGRGRWSKGQGWGIIAPPSPKNPGKRMKKSGSQEREKISANLGWMICFQNWRKDEMFW